MMPNEPIARDPEPRPESLSADLVILLCGRNARWLELTVGEVILPLMRWHARRGLRRTRGPAA